METMNVDNFHGTHLSLTDDVIMEMLGSRIQNDRYIVSCDEPSCFSEFTTRMGKDWLHWQLRQEVETKDALTAVEQVLRAQAMAKFVRKSLRVAAFVEEPIAVVAPELFVKGTRITSLEWVLHTSRVKNISFEEAFRLSVDHSI